jgi:beta-phosphoglucomutase-like phosphatase (HAD superfamily)
MAIIRAFLFDLDGTLVDSERLWVAAAEEVLREAGHPITHEEAVALVYGRAWGDTRAEMLRDYPDAFPTAAELERRMAAAFERAKGATDVRIPSSIALLKRLAATHPVGVVSGSSRRTVAEMLRLAGVEGDVRAVVATEDVPRGKPDPAPYLLAAEQLGVPPGECVAFEDSRAGVLSAKAAGMRVVALQRPGAPPQDLSEADLVADDLGGGEVTNLLGL